MPRITTKVSKTFQIPNDPNAAEVEIYYLKKGVRDRVEAEGSSYSGKLNEDTGEVETVILFNPKKKLRVWLEEVLKSWKGFVNHKGDEIRCNAENAIRVNDEDGKFIPWLQEISDKFNEEIDAEVEVASENSNS